MREEGVREEVSRHCKSSETVPSWRPISRSFCFTTDKTKTLLD